MGRDTGRETINSLSSVLKGSLKNVFLGNKLIPHYEQCTTCLYRRGLGSN